MTARIFRRAARAPAGLTWRRIARRLPVSAPRLTSAQTGRPSNFTVFVMGIVTLRVTDLGTEKKLLTVQWRTASYQAAPQVSITISAYQSKERALNHSWILQSACP